MTKLLYCENCGDIIMPFPSRRVPRWCRCERHAIWWTKEGFVRVYDKLDIGAKEPACFVMGLLNTFLKIGRHDDPWPDVTEPEKVRKIIQALGSEYQIFKDWQSVIVKSRPGVIPQIQYSKELPKAK